MVVGRVQLCGIGAVGVPRDPKSGNHTDGPVPRPKTSAYWWPRAKTSAYWWPSPRIQQDFASARRTNQSWALTSPPQNLFRSGAALP